MSNYDTSNILQSPAYQQELVAQRTFMARLRLDDHRLADHRPGRVGNDRSFNLGPSAFRRQPGDIFLALVDPSSLASLIGMSFMINKIPAVVAGGLFLLYSAITGVTFSILFLVYTQASIASTFFITAGMFWRNVGHRLCYQQRPHLHGGPNPLHGPDRVDHRQCGQHVHAEFGALLAEAADGAALSSSSRA